MKNFVVSMRRGVEPADVQRKFGMSLAAYLQRLRLVEIAETLPTGRRILVIGSDEAVRQIDQKLGDFCRISPLSKGQVL